MLMECLVDRNDLLVECHLKNQIGLWQRTSGCQALKVIELFVVCTLNLLVQNTRFCSNLWQAGNKDEGVIFLLTDSQITNERFLIYINDLLASGNIPDLFATDEVDTIVSDSDRA